MMKEARSLASRVCSGAFNIGAAAFVATIVIDMAAGAVSLGKSGVQKIFKG
jgi:hypothetical protein